MEPLLKLVAVRNNGNLVVSAEGEIDLASAPELRDFLGTTVGNVVVDLRRVTFLDSSGIHVLAEARKQLIDAGGNLTLRQPVRSVRVVLKIAGLDSWVEG
jgi:stage II sporulation protein AA (anti-sigma F factor antagonist)